MTVMVFCVFSVWNYKYTNYQPITLKIMKEIKLKPHPTILMNTKFISAPLPFQGQKRMFIKEFAYVIKETFSDALVFVDLFGGSGLLSRTVKDVLPHAHVVYNDYDHYTDRLSHIPQTNAILADIRQMVAGELRGQKLSAPTKDTICAYLRTKNLEGVFVDCLTLSASLLFSGKFAKDLDSLCSNGMYNTVVHRDYSASGYLDGIQVVHQDYRQVYEQYRTTSGVVFIVDPPYLATDKQSYKGYWGIAECLNVLQSLGERFIYFTSTKSEIIELVAWMDRAVGWSPFRDTQVLTRRNAVNGTCGYTDVMIFKR